MTTKQSSTAAGCLRVGLTVEQCWQRVPGGSGTYIVQLARELSTRTDLRAVGIAAAHAAPPRLEVPLAVRHVPLPRYALYRAWHRLRAPRAELVAPLDVVHATTWAIPATRRPLVVTVHDLAFLRDANHFTPRGVAFFERGLELALQHAAAVIAPSAATAADCVRAGFAPESVHVAPHGAPAWELPTEHEVARVRRTHGLPERYVLWCGTLEPRKNLPGLIEAFGIVAERDPEVGLVLAGPEGWGESLPRPTAAWASRVQHVGHVPSNDLPALYRGAEVFCYPSLWEGFGLPALEAMSVGTPVVTSADTSMAEVVGTAGVLVEPRDPEAIASGLVEATDRRAELSAAGLAAAASFTWRASADTHVKVYRSVLSVA